MSYKKISYLVSNFNNSISINKKYFLSPLSNFLISIVLKLKNLDIIKSFKIKNNKLLCYYNYKNWILKGYEKIKIISKVGKKLYLKNKNIIFYKKKLLILTTNLGILTTKECLEKKIGGEVILNIE
ncbi:30S ribosomal protein S8 [Candidatus Vidania fulgoroideorum]